MKTFRIIVLLLVLGINATAQENQNFAKILDTYVGTWVYQKNDTVFKIKFQKGQQLWTKKTANGLYGGYYLSVRGEVLENYMSGFPVYWDFSKDPRPNNMYIWVSNHSLRLDDINPNYVSVWFYDQRKRHFGGKGITGGYIQLLSPTKIRWKLDELTGIWNETEGDESISDAGRRPIGFSVPDDVIMTKE